jgi:hypothetical protein
MFNFGDELLSAKRAVSADNFADLLQVSKGLSRFILAV